MSAITDMFRTDLENMNPRDFQQRLCDQLENESFVVYYPDEHQYLKVTLLYAFYGPPKKLPEIDGDLITSYEETQIELMEKAYQKILYLSNVYSKVEGKIFMRIVYTCYMIDPEKVDFLVPVICLRKCKPSKTKEDCQPCEIIMDHHLQIYESWNFYLKANKHDGYKMVYPKQGRYENDSEGVMLSTEASIVSDEVPPASHTPKKESFFDNIFSVIKTIASGSMLGDSDISSGLVSREFVSRASRVAGVSSAAYATTSSSLDLLENWVHGKDLSFTNSVARDSYFNLGAGLLSLVSFGATTVLQHAVKSGWTVSEAVKGVVNTTNVMSTAATGASIANNTYEMINAEKPPNKLDVLQWATSVLFFQHSVRNFQTSSSIINSATMQSYLKSVTSNNKRRMINKLFLETERNLNGHSKKALQETITVLKKYESPETLAATLNAHNRMFNSQNVRFSAENGQILLNGKAVDINILNKLPTSVKADFISKLPRGDPSISSGRRMNLAQRLDNESLIEMANNFVNAAQDIASIIERNENIKELLDVISTQTFEAIIKKLDETDPELLKMLSDLKANVTAEFFYIMKGVLIFAMENYCKKETQEDNIDYNTIISKIDFNCPETMGELMNYLHAHLAKTIIELNEYITRKNDEQVINTEKQDCETCEGYNYCEE